MLKFTADNGKTKSASTLHVAVETPPPARATLHAVYTRNFKLNSKFWNARAKALIVDWIPHCIDVINATRCAGTRRNRQLLRGRQETRGEPAGRHKGFVFSNAWVYQTVESMCIALMVDARAIRKSCRPISGCAQRSRIGSP